MTATGSLMASAQSRPVPNLRERAAAHEQDKLRQQLDQALAKAEAAAAQGDIASSAKLILTALDCERRLASRGPQVLQLIKPRN